MNLPDIAVLILISAGCVMSCSGATGDSANTPTGGTSGVVGGASTVVAGTSSGVGGAVGSAGVTGSAGTFGAGGHGGATTAGSGGSGTLGGMNAGGAAGSSSGGTAGKSSANGGSANGGSANGGGKTAGCGQAPKLTSGTKSIQSGGKSRSFMIRVPEAYDNTHPYWLIFGYHWVGGTANDVDSGGTSAYTWSYYGLREQADKSDNAHAIFVAPQGLNNGWGNTGNEDVVFNDDMVKQVEDGLCVDTKHVFATGFSYGGGMTKALGCQRPSVFRAIAVYSGADFLSGGCDGTSTAPVAFFGSHSITDGTNPYSSGITILNRFAGNNGCTAQTPPQPAQGSLTHICTKFTGCKDGYPVEWCAFNGGGHSPAPVDGDSSGSGGGDKTWTKGEVWKFFTQFQ
ncbi:MAG: PHB depolymerase family esterase [Polyangiaceae bacterium]